MLDVPLHERIQRIENFISKDLREVMLSIESRLESIETRLDNLEGDEVNSNED